ncbi:ARM repeat-containing protein, partial [Neocallimastix californiae]
MGNINSNLVITSSIDNYLSEIEGFKYKKSLGSALFLKTICCKHEEGLVVVKIYKKDSLNINLKSYIKELEDVKQQLNEIPNAFPFQQIIETEKVGYLVRQYFPNNLYDRISTRPFLNTIEKKWISYQLLKGLSEAHKRGIFHGDIKTENIMVTSWNWVYLSDFAGFKPTYLPEDNPEWFSFFFDSSGRRTCYIASERFYASNDILLQPEITKDGKLTAEMDIFSLGCVIAELFLEGSSIFTFSQLLRYRNNKYDPSAELEKIQDIHIRSLIKDMIQLDPEDRKSADYYLEHWKGKAFPNYFYDFLHQYISSFTDLSLYSNSDDKIESIYKNFETVIKSISLDDYVNNNINDLLEILEYTNFNLEEEIQKLKFEFVPTIDDLLRMHDGGCQISITFICSNIRNVMLPSSKIYALDMLFFLALCISDQYKLDQVLPYILTILQEDENSYVKMNAIQKLVKLLQTVRSISPEDINIFTDYIYPYLKPLSKDPDVLVKATYAKYLSDIADIASRFIELSHNDQLSNGNGLDSDDYYQQETYDNRLNLLREIIGKETNTLLIDPNACVKRALLSNISNICIFLGEQKTNDMILSHMITYLNDQENWILRDAFWKCVVGIGAFVGTRSLSEYIIPLMIQALKDKEEFNVVQLLNTITSFSELDLLQRDNIKDLAEKIIPLFYHPNIYIRLGAISFISSMIKSLSPEDVQFIIYPQIKPYLSTSEHIELNEKNLLSYLKPGLKREYFNYAINNLSSNSDKLYLQNNINQSDSNIEADALSEEDLQKIYLLRYYIKPLQKQKRIEQNNDYDKNIDLRNFGAILHTVFLEPPTQELKRAVLNTYNKEISRYEGKTSDMLNNRHYSKSYSQLNSIKNQQYINTTNKAASRSAQDLTTSWIVVDKIQQSPSKISSSYVVNNKLIGGVVDKANNTNVSNRRRSFLKNPTPSMKNIKAIPETGTSYETGIPTLEGINDTNSFEKTIASSPTNSITSSLSTTNLLSFDESNDKSEKITIHLNEDSSKKSVKSQNKKFDHIRNKPSGINRYSINRVLKQIAHDYFPPEINLGKVVGNPSFSSILNNRQKNKNEDLHDSDIWKPEGILISSFCEHSSKINQLCISSDNAFIGSCSNDGTLKIWDCNRLEKNVTNRSKLNHCQGGNVTSISFCENRHSIISASDNGSIHISRIEYMNVGGHLKHYKFERVREMILDDGEYITNINHYNTELESVVVMSSSHGSICGFDLRTMKTVWKLDTKPNYGYISAFAVNPSSYWLCSGTSKGVMTLWDIRFSLPVSSWAHPSLTKINKMKLFPSSSNGNNLNESKQVLCAVDNGNNELSSWNVETKKCTEIWCSEKFNSKKFYENGLKAVEPEIASSLLTINSSSGKHKNSINSFTFLDNPNYYRLQLPFIVSVGSDRRIRYWDQIKINQSMILNGGDIADQNISYRTNRRNSVNIHYESYDSTSTLNSSNSSPLNSIGSIPLHYSNYNPMSKKLNGHMDSITDVAYTVVPYPLIITSGRDGIINIWK